MADTQHRAETQRIYLDNAATSWPKPQTVYDAVDQFQRSLGAAAGRSGYQSANAVSRLVDQSRSAVAKLLNADRPNQIAFMFNGTDALNTAIHGTLRPSDHVVTSVAEHNSVLRPLAELRSRTQIDVTYVRCDREGRVLVPELQAALRPNTRLVAINQASNVTGLVQPIQEIADTLINHPALLLVDAAQSLGHIPVEVHQGIDLLASSGHKGLLGPLGTGILYVGPKASEKLQSLRQGGTGTSSEDDHQPSAMPEKLESGNLNVPGLAGLLAGIQFIENRGLANLRQHEIELTSALLSGLPQVGAKVFGPATANARVGVVSWNLEGHDPHEVATLLDAIANIECRSGLHCAPRMHQHLGTAERNGTVRVSVGPYTTVNDIESLLATVETIKNMGIGG